MINKLIFSLFILLFSTSSFGAGADDLLKPDDAFSASISLASPDKLKATWDIADGYYMYRKRFSFESATPGITLGTPLFPKGKIKDDPGFGKVEVYRHKVNVEIPVIRDTSASKALLLDLKTKSQGCADIGVCYPPQKKILAIKLANTDSSASSSTQIAKSSIAAKKTINLAKELGITGLGSTNAPLPPDEAFAYDITAIDKQNLIARWDITKGHYLYQHKIKFTLIDPTNDVALGKPALPKGKAEHDQYFGDIVTYNESFDVKIPVIGNTDELVVKASYQGCSKLTGICYPPQSKTQSIDLTKAPDARKTTQTVASTSSALAIDSTKSVDGESDANSITLSNTQKISTGNNFLDKSLNSNSLWGIFFAALGAGLLLAFTACMYPMIPILSSIIVGQGEEVSIWKGLTLSSVYVLSLAITFGIVGAITASVAGGIGIQAYFQNPWVLTAFSLLFIILAFSMFGFYDIQVPAALQNKLSSLSNNQKGGSLIGVAIMGALSALIVGPCGGPVLAAMLGYAAASASMLKGFAALFALGLGMGLPLLIVGAGGGKLLPKAGNWMSAVKATAGVILLAVSLIILERMPHLFPPTLTMLLWALLLIVSGIYLGAFSANKEGASGWSKLWKGLGVAAVIYGAIVMFGGQMGGLTVTDPLYGIKSGTNSPISSQSGDSASLEHVTFKRIKSTQDLKNEILLAKQQGKAVMLDFYADWCTYCIKYERYVFPDPSVRKYLDKIVLLQADVTSMDKTDEELMKVLGVSLPPAILFFDNNGKEIPLSRILGDMNVKEFSDHLAKTFK